MCDGVFAKEIMGKMYLGKSAGGLVGTVAADNLILLWVVGSRIAKLTKKNNLTESQGRKAAHFGVFTICAFFLVFFMIGSSTYVLSKIDELEGLQHFLKGVVIFTLLYTVIIELAPESASVYDPLDNCPVGDTGFRKCEIDGKDPPKFAQKLARHWTICQTILIFLFFTAMWYKIKTSD